MGRGLNIILGLLIGLLSANVVFELFISENIAIITGILLFILCIIVFKKVSKIYGGLIFILTALFFIGIMLPALNMENTLPFYEYYQSIIFLLGLLVLFKKPKLALGQLPKVKGQKTIIVKYNPQTRDFAYKLGWSSHRQTTKPGVERTIRTKYPNANIIYQ
jgi:hypothetical protein